jgi:hypothetical protein
MTQHEDSVLQYMIEHKVEMTRENYLSLAYFGDDVSALEGEGEFEAGLPEMFQSHGFPWIDEAEFE